MRGRNYVAGSAVAAIAVIWHAFVTREQFFPSMVHLSNSKFSVAVLGNFGFAIAYTVYKFITWAFLGRLRDSEIERINDKVSQAIIETLIAMTIFRQDFTIGFISAFVILSFIKIFHWMVQDRVDFIETTPNVTRSQHIRIVTLSILLITVDYMLLHHYLTTTLTKGVSIHLMFAFEYAIQASTACVTLCKYFLSVIDMTLEGRWESKGVAVFYLELALDLLHLITYSAFFAAVFSKYGIPIHLIRDLYWTFRNFQTRVRDFLRFRRVAANMDRRFPDATEEDFERADHVCIVCREEMRPGCRAKKLDCGHTFHLHCLRSWLERQQNCPICRATVVASVRERPPQRPRVEEGRRDVEHIMNNNNNNNNRQHENQLGNENPAAAAAAGEGANNVGGENQQNEQQEDPHRAAREELTLVFGRETADRIIDAVTNRHPNDGLIAGPVMSPEEAQDIRNFVRYIAESGFTFTNATLGPNHAFQGNHRRRVRVLRRNNPLQQQYMQFPYGNMPQMQQQQQGGGGMVAVMPVPVLVPFVAPPMPQAAAAAAGDDGASGDNDNRQQPTAEQHAMASAIAAAATAMAMASAPPMMTGEGQQAAAAPLPTATTTTSASASDEDEQEGDDTGVEVEEEQGLANENNGENTAAPASVGVEQQQEPSSSMPCAETTTNQPGSSSRPGSSNSNTSEQEEIRRRRLERFAGTSNL